MQVLQFRPGHAPEFTGIEGAIEQAGFFWLDIERNETDWQKKVQRWLGIHLHEQHVRDTLNELHQPFYDGTDDYDLFIAHAPCPDCSPEAPTTRPIALIVTANAVVTVRSQRDTVFGKLHRGFLSTQQKSPTSPPMLLYLLLDRLTVDLMNRLDVTSELLPRWEESLLSDNGPFDDWQALLRLRGRLRRMEAMIENQLDALTLWREQTSLPVDPSLAVRFNALRKHLRRVYNHAIVMQHDIDSLVQIYFSANAQRTNKILQFLTIVSAVFLPLNLLAGVFGMNFVSLPLLQLWYGPWIVVWLMLVILSGLLYWFRRRRWI